MDFPTNEVTESNSFISAGSISSKAGLTGELIEFEEHLKSKGVLEICAHRYPLFAAKALSEINDIYSLKDWHDFSQDWFIRRKNVAYFYAVRRYVEWKFKDKQDADFKKQLLEMLENVKPTIAQRKKLPKVVDDESIARVINAMDIPKFKLVARIQQTLGLRAADVMRMKVGSILYEQHKDKIIMSLVIRGKGDKYYKMWVFEPQLQSEIEEHIMNKNSDPEYYFIDSSRDGDDAKKYLNEYQSYKDCLSRSLRANGIPPYTWASHDFRRAIARKLWSKQKDIMMLKTFLHHSMISTTMKYLESEGLSVLDTLEEMHEDKEKEASNGQM